MKEILSLTADFSSNPVRVLEIGRRRRQRLTIHAQRLPPARALILEQDTDTPRPHFHARL